MQKHRKIDWVICAAGNGNRFKDFGINIPKPSIKLQGSSFLERSLACLDMLPGDKVILIIQKNNGFNALFKKIKLRYPWVKFVLIELIKNTSGQLSTFLKAEKHLRRTASVVIWNCDTYFKSIRLPELLRYTDIDAVVPCGKLEGERWSFFKTDKNNLVTRCKEKERISPWCSVGFYHFKDSIEIISLAKEITKQNPSKKLKEHYVSSLYPILISDKSKKILNCPVELFLPFGTVQDIKKYWKVSITELKKENSI